MYICYNYYGDDSMIPFQYNNDESFNFIKRINKISIRIDSVVDYDQLRRMDKDELFTTIKSFFKEMFPVIYIDLERLLINDAKGFVDNSGIIPRKISHQIKYVFNKEYEESVTNRNLSSIINLNGTISDYFTLACEYIHLISYYNSKNGNEDLKEVESFFVERLLSEYLLNKGLINLDEANNFEKIRINKLYDAVNYCNEVIDGNNGNHAKFSKSMAIIYGEAISNQLYILYRQDEDKIVRLFENYIRDRDTYNNINLLYELFLLDEREVINSYSKHINKIKSIPLMESNYDTKDSISFFDRIKKLFGGSKR